MNIIKYVIYHILWEYGYTVHGQFFIWQLSLAASPLQVWTVEVVACGNTMTERLGSGKTIVR